MKWILKILINAAVFVLLMQVFEGVHVSGFGTAIIAAIVLSICNVIVKPIVTVLTIPITIVTLGIFLLFINTIVLSIVDAVMGGAFQIDGFWLTFFVSVILSFVNTIMENVME